MSVYLRTVSYNYSSDLKTLPPVASFDCRTRRDHELMISCAASLVISSIGPLSFSVKRPFCITTFSNAVMDTVALGLSRSRTVCQKIYAVLELPVPLVFFLYCTCTSVLRTYSPKDSKILLLFAPQNMTTEFCSAWRIYEKRRAIFVLLLWHRACCLHPPSYHLLDTFQVFGNNSAM